jgi:hypothetical protein
MGFMSVTKRKFTTNARLLHQSLTKYPNTFRALLELLNNSVQADSKNVYITFDYGDLNKMEPFIKTISVLDDGNGVPASEFDVKILEIATNSKDGGEGVGRFAAFQIGAFMEIDTVAFDKAKGKWTEVNFSLDANSLTKGNLDDFPFDVNETVFKGTKKSSYQVVIKHLYQSLGASRVPARQRLTSDFGREKIGDKIFEHYPFQIFNRTVKFHINGVELKREDFIIGDPIIKSVEYITSAGIGKDIRIMFYNVKNPKHNVKLFFSINHGGLQTPVKTFNYSSDWHTPDLGTWYIYVESEMFNTDLFRNIDMEEWGGDELANIKNFVKDNVDSFFRDRNERFKKFVQKLEADESNPLKKKKVSSPSEEIVFNKIAFLIEDEYHLLENQEKTKDVVYSLLDEAISNGQIRSIFEKVVKLSPGAINKLNALLDKTDLENIIHFATEVAKKKQFLDFFHEIVYGEISKVLRERSQLHKIVEKQLWLFGEQYSNTPVLWSDRKIGNIIEELRQQHFEYLPTKEDDNLIDGIVYPPGVDDITDLFILSEKVNGDESREILIVELKSPKCAISQKEINQIDRYAFALEQHNALPRDNVKYKVILVSSRLTPFAKSRMQSAFETHRVAFLYDKKKQKDIELYVIEWSEIIESNKRRLKYLSNNLDVREREVREVFEDEYPQLINQNVESTLKISREKNQFSAQAKVTMPKNERKTGRKDKRKKPAS